MNSMVITTKDCILLVMLLLQLVCCSQTNDPEFEIIEGSDNRSPTVKAIKPKKSPKFNCIVCDDIRNASCPRDKFSKNCYTDERIDKTKPVGCRWMVQQVQGRTYTSRHCTNLVDDSIQGCVDRVGSNKIKVTYCHCRTENCNGAPGLKFGFSLPLALLLLKVAASGL